MFSSRVPSDLEPNRLSRAVKLARAERRPVIDLTISNPTHAGIHYSEALLQPLASARALTYDPEPFGSLDARRAVAADFARRGTFAIPDRVVLTSSTSEAYTVLFKLLCDPVEHAVMVPVPSYPLFAHLTQLDGVRSIHYRLEYHDRWAVDLASVDEQWCQLVRALLTVSPNNPTGSLLSGDELAALTERCAERHTAMIIDEVFADYPLHEGVASGFSRTSRCLTFRLGGLSKSAGLPQVKLGWFAVDGPDALVEQALQRLELICDTYLSVSTPVQVAAASLIANGASIRAEILTRVRENHCALSAAVSGHPSIEVLRSDAGWSAVIRVPAARSEEELVLDLLDRDGVLVHPGFFFDFAHEAFLVVSLLPEPQIFSEGIRRLLERVNA